MAIPQLCEEDFKIDITKFKTGGEASVFKSHHLHYGDVAVKKYKVVFRDDEIKLLKENVHHSNIVRLIGILTDSSTPPKRVGYIMSYMKTGSLDEIIHNKGKNYDGIYTNEQITLWINKICCGLSYLHSRNIIHRDIKPSNVLLGESYDDVQLSDFGIARSISSITRRGLTTGCGTPFYMAPEVFKGQKYDISADIHSLSITIWEILHRRFPYDHFSVQFNLLDKISKRKRPELSKFLSKEVSDILVRCWDASPSLRPTITDVLEFSRKTIFQVPEEETILLLGGEGTGGDLNSLLILQNNREKWKRSQIELLYPIQSHGAQFFNNNLYIFGGCNRIKKGLNWTYRLSKSLQWEEMADMNDRRSYISKSSVILNNQIWVCGGEDENEDSLKSVEMEMNKFRADAAAAVVNGKIFCSGGYNRLDDLDSVECYDLSSDVWTVISNMPTDISITVKIDGNVIARGHGAVGMNGNFIVIGARLEKTHGMFFAQSYSNKVWALDTMNKNAVWIEKPFMSTVRRHFSIAKIRDKVFVCGGETNENGTWMATNSVEIFDGEVPFQRYSPKMPTTRVLAPAVVIPMSFARYLN